MTPSPAFGGADFHLALQCVARLKAYILTEPEIRACHAVIKQLCDGMPMNEDDALVAKCLFDNVRGRTRWTAQ